jgi:hypothetical protein
MLRRVLLSAATMRRFTSNAPNTNTLLTAAAAQHQQRRAADADAAAALARALFVDEPASSPATESILSRVYDVNESVASRVGATSPASATVVERDVFAQPTTSVIPGALGDFKVVIEDLPKAATEEDIVRALSIDLDAIVGNKANQKKHQNTPPSPPTAAAISSSSNNTNSSSNIYCCIERRRHHISIAGAPSPVAASGAECLPPVRRSTTRSARRLLSKFSPTAFAVASATMRLSTLSARATCSRCCRAPQSSASTFAVSAARCIRRRARRVSL